MRISWGDNLDKSRPCSFLGCDKGSSSDDIELENEEATSQFSLHDIVCFCAGEPNGGGHGGMADGLVAFRRYFVEG